SLAYSISVNELMSQAYQISAVTFQYLQVYAITGLIYVIIAVPSTWASVYVEHRLARGQA
ncbi:amino acid ABC transporter permease, partial [Salmonella enterica subsp. enterica serovar Oranienburg]|nr:amino acid ABC transporter permease [Salmonella enterica subsp. enterica serovar Oranienburg]